MAWQTIIYVGVGGFLGANARYWVSLWVNAWSGNMTGWRVPFGTAFVNITGSFLLAIFLVWSTQKIGFSDQMKLLVGTGFFGAYTTFSTYANESINLLSGDERLTGILYIIATNGLCLLGVVLGITLMNRLTG